MLKFYKKYLYNKDSSNIFHIFLTKLLNRFLKQGHKEKSFKLYFKLKYLIKKYAKKEPLFIFFFSLLKGLFKFYFIKKRLGRIFKDLPMHLSKESQVRLFVKTLYRLSYSNYKREISIQNLTNLIISTFRRKSILIKLNNKNYRKALENRVFLFLLKKRK